jgi:HK97 family phage major capsid protein
MSTILDSVRKTRADFLAEVIKAGDTGYHPDLQPFAAAPGMRSDVDSLGGFLIPGDWAEDIWTKMYTTSEVLGRCEDFGAPAGNRHYLPCINESSRADGSRHGSVCAYWTREAAAISDSKMKLGVQTRGLRKIIALGYITDEMLEDVPQLVEFATRVFSLELSFAFAEAIINGTGADRPQGLLHSPAKICVDKITNQTAGTIWPGNVTAMIARMWPGSFRTSCWLFNPELLPQLSALADQGTFGSGATDVGIAPGPLWNWDGNAYSGGWPTLCGRPAIPIESCQTAGTEGDLILTSLKDYGIVAKPRGVLSMHVRFIYNESAFRLSMRCDGASLWGEPLTPIYGSSTFSPIVTLTTRA